MMMNHILKSQCKVSPGTVITGKWHSNQYTILKELGYGANGVVYLANHNNTQVALKMSENGLSITSEVNVLKSFAKVQGSALGPSLLDVDDWKTNRGQISFYVMEYIKGPDFLSFIEQKGKSWILVLMLQLLNDLEKLHQNGWVFGDLKPENLIVTGPPPKIRCIDVGGTTIAGRAIKEFTEFYDRGYWGLGSRVAEPSYDLFSLAMIIINTGYPKRFTKKSGGLSQLTEAIRQQPELHSLEKVMVNALKGHYTNARQMRQELLELLADDPAAKHRLKPRNAHASIAKPLSDSNKGMAKTRQQYRRKKKRTGWIETGVIAAVFIIFYVVVILKIF